MTDIAVLGSTNMDLVAYVEKAPQRGETVTGREFRTIPGGKGANQAIAAARAGDTFVGSLADGGTPARVKPGVGELGEDRPVREAPAWAAAAAALSVQRPGASASTPYRSEIEKQYAS